MLLFLLLFGLALGAESPASNHEMKLQRGNCPMFWFSFNGHCYKYVSSRITWTDAEFHCLSEKTNLVSIHIMKEQKFVTSLIKHYDPAQGSMLIGFSDIYKEGRWMWSDGSALDFAFWDAGEPNNQYGREHCACQNYGGHLKWNDGPYSLTCPFVCTSHVCP